MRDELLDGEIFLTLVETKYVVDRWRMDYNHYRPHTITWRYAVPSDARPADLIVNGSTVSSNIAFAPTGSWTDWTTQSVNVTLSSGTKSVRLEAAGSNGLGNIDYMEITGPGVVAMNCN